MNDKVVMIVELTVDCGMMVELTDLKEEGQVLWITLNDFIIGFNKFKWEKSKTQLYQ